MFDFTDEQKMVRQMVRRWCEQKLAPAVDDLEAERVLPYDLMRDFIRTFGVDEMARASLKRLEEAPTSEDKSSGMRDVAMGSIVGMEQSRYSPGFAMSFGASVGLYGG